MPSRALAFYFLVKILASKKITTPTINKTNNTPDHTPALKISPMTSQPLNKKASSVVMTIDNFFMFSEFNVL
jgi:hypothetical protein